MATEPRLVRAHRFDTRIARGDDFASDAYRDTLTGKIVRVGVGLDPNNIELPDHTPDMRQLPLLLTDEDRVDGSVDWRCYADLVDAA